MKAEFLVSWTCFDPSYLCSITGVFLCFCANRVWQIWKTFPHCLVLHGSCAWHFLILDFRLKSLVPRLSNLDYDQDIMSSRPSRPSHLRSITGRSRVDIQKNLPRKPARLFKVEFWIDHRKSRFFTFGVVF